MSCYHPLIFLYVGENSTTGKKILRLDNSSLSEKKTGEYFNDKHFLRVPCGQCLGCRLDYAKQWGERCCLEASLYPDNIFLTLTYDDENLPLDKKVHKKDFQDFIKKLRKKYPDKRIRYFGCGEYGTKTKRPHYHLIIFNFKPNDLKKHNKNFNNDIIYTSETISKIWNKGFITIGEVNYNTCNYTARYILKKQKGKIKTDEFVLMSTRPGIGYNYFEKYKDEILLNKMIYFSFNKNKKTATINKYFKKLFEKFNLELKEDYYDLVNERVRSQFINNRHLYGVSDDFDLYNIKEDIQEASIKSLKRSLD